MDWLYSTLDDVFAALNPWTRSRQIYVHGRRGWRQLLAGLSPSTRYLLLAAFFWNAPAAMTEPFKSLYLTKLGLDSFALGGINGLDMGLRGFGMLLGGWLGTRYGHKRTLLAGDLLSWVVSTVVLALATTPTQIIFWACLMATNSVVVASYQYLVLRQTPKDARVGAYGFANMASVLPMLVLPFVSSMLLHHFDFVLTMRCLFGFQALSIATGIYVRLRLVEDDRSDPRPEASSTLVARLKAVSIFVWKAPGSGTILLIWIFFNIGINLWRVYFSLYAVDRLACPEANLGYYSQLSSLAFVAASLYWLPRFSTASQKKSFFFINVASLCAPLLLLAGQGIFPMASSSLSFGLVSGIRPAILASLLASILPEAELALAYALCMTLLQALIGLSFPLAGALFKGHMVDFAFCILAINGLQAVLAWSLWKRRPA